MFEGQPLLEGIPNGEARRQANRDLETKQAKKGFTTIGFALLFGFGCLVLFTYSHLPVYTKSLSSDQKGTLTSTGVTPPHVFFFLVDDQGYNDIGYNSVDLPHASPFMDGLALQGVKLDHYITMPQCTPARATLLTGRYVITTGMQHECITSSSPWALPKKYDIIPSYLKLAGYQSHMIGKWDLGHYSFEYWPTNRDFDSSFHLTSYGYSDYTTHVNYGYYDVHNDLENVGSRLNGLYATKMWSQQVQRVIRDRHYAVLAAGSQKEVAPIFVYCAFNAIHNNVAVPDNFKTTAKWAELTANITCWKRQDLAGALYLLDQEISDIVAMLNSTAMLDNSVLLFASDNGGSPTDGGNNWPLRGAKKTMFQGGIHVPSFVYSHLLHPSAKGTRYGSLFHVSDWLPTIVSGIVGLDSASLTAGDMGIGESFSGEDQWAALQGLAPPPRQEALINIDYMLQDNYTSVAEELDHVFAGLIREVDGVTYKLIRFQEASGYYRPFSSETYKPSGWTHADLNGYKDYLFDLTHDSTEETNLIDDERYASVVKSLQSRICEFYNKHMVSTQYHPMANDSAVKAWNLEVDPSVVPWVSKGDETSEYPISLAPSCPF